MTPRRPRPYRPHTVRWQGAECDRCAAPILIVIDDAKAARIQVNPTETTAGTVAARMIGQQMHGFVITPTRPQPAGYYRFTLHVETCEDPPEPAHVQEGLPFDQPRGTTHQ